MQELTHRLGIDMSNFRRRQWNRFFSVLGFASPQGSNNGHMSVDKQVQRSEVPPHVDRSVDIGVHSSPAQEVVRHPPLLTNPHPLLIELRKVIDASTAWAKEHGYIPDPGIRHLCSFCSASKACEVTLKSALRQYSEDNHFASQVQGDDLLWKALKRFSGCILPITELHSVVIEQRGSFTKWLSIHADIERGGFQVYEKENDCDREVGGERFVAKHDSYELAVRDIGDRALLASLLDEQSSLTR